CERSENVSVSKNNVAGVQERENLPFVAIGEVCAMDQRERRRRQQLAFLPLSCRLSNDCRRVPLGEEHFVAVQFEPPFEQVNLRGFPGTVQSLDGDKLSSDRLSLLCIRH